MSEQLYWHCECGNNEPAQPEYEHWDSEPCCLCENGTARVVTIKEAAAWEQARALGHSWRPEHGSVLTTACHECRGKGQVVIGFGFPGDESANGTIVEDCDRCGGTGRM